MARLATVHRIRGGYVTAKKKKPTKKTIKGPKLVLYPGDPKLSLYPGRFYEAKNGELWCCISLELFRRDHCQANCARVGSQRQEYFYRDGRYDADSNSELTLVREVIAAHAVVL